jgi:hypothetical protein
LFGGQAMATCWHIVGQLAGAGRGISRSVEVAQNTCAVADVRDFWRRVTVRLTLMEPQEAFACPPLDHLERYMISGFRREADLAKLAARLRDRFEAKADRGVALIRASLGYVMLGYIALSIFTLWYPASVIKQGLSDSIQAYKAQALGGAR